MVVVNATVVITTKVKMAVFVNSEYLTTQGRNARIVSASVTGCQNDNVAYNVDTEPGNSGSPILSAVDNTVISLHNCGGCKTDGTGANTGNKMTNIVKILTAKNLLPKDVIKKAAC